MKHRLFSSARMFILVALVITASFSQTMAVWGNSSIEDPHFAASPPTSVTYIVQSGDTLAVLAKRFGVQPGEIKSSQPLADDKLLPPGLKLSIPWKLPQPYTSVRLFPDSEVVYSPSSARFNVSAYLSQQPGYLSKHREYMRSSFITDSADILLRVAQENSINPRVLLSLLEYECHCVLDNPGGDPLKGGYLVGNTSSTGLYGILSWMANELSTGYYGWRNGRLGEILLPDGEKAQLSPDTNAGSVAILYYFARRLETIRAAEHGEKTSIVYWRQATDPETGLPALHEAMFGDMQLRAQAVEPLLPAGLTQPTFILPFEPGKRWSLTSGPHMAWSTNAALAALDFAPAIYPSGCTVSKAWVTALADGVVTRSDFGAVVLDLDPDVGKRADGLEQTGWAIFYLHIREQDRVPVGTRLRVGERIGHPSCEGGPATGTHVHVARKYNGEWMDADGPIAFIMDGWTAHAGEKPYRGLLTKDGITITANSNGASMTFIDRPVITETVKITSQAEAMCLEKVCP